METILRYRCDNSNESMKRYDVLWPETETCKTIGIYGVKHGVVSLFVMCGTNLHDVARVVSGCFDYYSNFEETVLKSTGYASTSIHTIQFDFNGVPIFVTKHDTEQIIIESWKRKMNIEEDSYRSLELHRGKETFYLIGIHTSMINGSEIDVIYTSDSSIKERAFYEYKSDPLGIPIGCKEITIKSVGDLFTVTL